MPQGVEYAIRYYREKFWTDRYAAAGISKPVGWQLSPHRYNDRNQAVRCVDHINRQRPTYPIELVTLWNGVER